MLASLRIIAKPQINAQEMVSLLKTNVGLIAAKDICKRDVDSWKTFWIAVLQCISSTHSLEMLDVFTTYVDRKTLDMALPKLGLVPTSGRPACARLLWAYN